MPRFAIRTPFFIIVMCLAIAVLGVNALTKMPVDMFPAMNIPVVVVATFYTGMPPEQIETTITSRFERFFTLGSGIDRIESRSLPGVSIIKVTFQPGSNADSAVTTISNLAMANLRRLPPGTLPPIVMKFDASSLPVALLTFKGEGLTETRLRDLAQVTVRNQVASVPGASVPQPFGGTMRQIMVYANPNKLEAYGLSLMDVVRSLSTSNLILPAGDLQVGERDYNIYTNSQLRDLREINQLPVKMDGLTPIRIADIGETRDAQQLQTNIVRVDGQRSVYLPVLKQGGDSNTIEVVEGLRKAAAKLVDVPKELKTDVVFDQSEFVKTAIETLLHEGAIGLVLTSIMILVFLGSMRATLAVFFSIPLSALATFLALSMSGGSINSMVLGGLALAFSRLIDNSVVVLENIFRHLELGERPEVAAEKGGQEVALPVLASTITTAVVFFPVTMLFGVSRYLFSALALAVVISLAASYIVAMTVVPLFCARFIRLTHPNLQEKVSWGQRFNNRFNAVFDRGLGLYERMLGPVLRRPIVTLAAFGGIFALTFVLYPAMGMSYFPRTDPGQFVMNLKLPSGTRLSVTEQNVAKVEGLVREVVPEAELGKIVSNIGITPDFSAVYTPNAGMHTGFVQVSLAKGHKLSSHTYMERVRQRIASDLPQIETYFQTGGLVDAVLNMGMPAPIDIQVSGSNLERNFAYASELASRVRELPNVAETYIPQNLDYPALKLDIDRVRAGQLGLTQREIVDNVVTALNSSGMIAPNFWIDPRSGNDYLLAVQYGDNQIRDLEGLKAIPIRGARAEQPARLDAMSKTSKILSPTEVAHAQLRRTVDIYVRPQGEDMGELGTRIERAIANSRIPDGTLVEMRGSIQAMLASFRSFGTGLILALVLLYLVLVAQFRSFSDPFIILLAVPPGIMGVLITLVATGTTLNVMSLMGIVMLVGIAVSNSILIVEFTNHLRSEGMEVREAVATACRVRLRPVLMTSLATLIGLLPMALKLGEGSEAYAPLARAIIGGLAVSVVFTVVLVPAGYFLLHRNDPFVPVAVPHE